MRISLEEAQCLILENVTPLAPVRLPLKNALGYVLAQDVAAGMPFYVWNFSDEFRCEVIDRFAAAYAAGRTPNPCIDCNRYLKFGALLRRARALGFDALATGHYARVEKSGGQYLLKKAGDETKDQSYVLYMSILSTPVTVAPL